MDCPDCERIDAVVFPTTHLWLWAPTDESHAKIAGVLGAESFSAKPFGARGVHLTLEAAAAKRFGLLLMGGLGAEELGGVKVVSSPSPTLSPDDLQRFMTGAALVARIEAEWLTTSVADRRYETWFQPIVDCRGELFAHEALFRLREKDGAIIAPGRAFAVARDAELLFSLDLISRRCAVETAARAGLDGRIFINFNPSSVYDPAYCLRTTASAIAELGLRPDNIVFEVTETDRARDMRHLKGILAFYRNAGFRVALDDVGSGYSSLNLMSEVRPDYVKIDMDLIRGVDADPYKQTIVKNLFAIAQGNGVRTIAEGIETQGERDWLQWSGADLMQGYLFGRPAPMAAPRDGVPRAAA